MEYACGGDLGSYIKKNSFMMSKEQKIKKFSWAQKVVREILIGIESVHKLGFVYRDLKPSNVLINHKGILCDI
jgi:serine/threonine-protein kinase RIM15